MSHPRGICENCEAPEGRRYLRDHGACRDCVRTFGFELRGVKREAVVAEFLAWLDGRMPSEAIRQEAAARKRTQLEDYVYMNARRLNIRGRTRPDARDRHAH